MWTIPGLCLCLVAASEAPRADRRRLAAYNYQEVAKLTAADATSGDEFGRSVAIDGATVVVGAYRKNSYTGAVYVLRTTDGGASYGQVAKLAAADGAADDLFGTSVAIDGATVVIGAPDAGTGGAVYVFRTSDGGATYDQVAKLTADDAAASDYFGVSVAIDGDTVVVGAFSDDSDRGSAYVFRTSDGATYVEVAKLTAADAATGDVFGNSVAIAGDTVVVGAQWDDDGGSASGSAYVFDPNRPTSQPTPTPTLPPTFRPTLEPTSQPTTQQPTPQPRQQQQPDSLATILICVAAAVVFACGCLAYARYVRYGSRKGPKSDLEPLAEPEGTTPAPTKEATVLSIPPEAELEAEAGAEQPPPPPTKGWFWREEPKPEPEGEAEEALAEQPPQPPFFRAEPEIEPEPGEAEELPPPLSPFSTLRAEREQELAFEPEPEA
jgi:hypothetical protein